jgi:hypothetical protein
MPLNEVLINSELVDQGKLVIRKDTDLLRIKFYRKNPKLSESGTVVYGWTKWEDYISLYALTQAWHKLLNDGAIEG